ncbi:MAG: hypothetical protein ACLT38_12385 [Akkermansia sp.]
MRRKQGKRHILQKKSSKRKRQQQGGSGGRDASLGSQAEPAFRLNRGNARLMPSFPPLNGGLHAAFFR